jgi:hypothetical protein
VQTKAAGPRRWAIFPPELGAPRNTNPKRDYRDASFGKVSRYQ